jgi:GNAT superfamily N-acetyltransferase
MIRKAHTSEVDTLTDLVSKCGKHMRENGIQQWLEGYPNREIIEADVEEGTVFVLEEDGKIKSMVVLNEKQDPEYQELDWLTNSKSKNLVVHRLATFPKYQGQGLGSKMMSFAEDYARKNKYDSIRLDTFSQNKGNIKYYENKAYTKIGAVNLKYRIDFNYICFEKVFSK